MLEGTIRLKVFEFGWRTKLVPAFANTLRTNGIALLQDPLRDSDGFLMETSQINFELTDFAKLTEIIGGLHEDEFMFL